MGPVVPFVGSPIRRAAIGLILRTLNALGIFLDARNEPAEKAKTSASKVDLDAIIEAARKPRP